MRIVLMTAALAGLVIAAVAWGQGDLGPAAGGASQTLAVDRAALEKMVRDEVARQMPEAVAKELARQVELQRVQVVKNSAMSTLLTVRSIFELFKTQHGEYPMMAGMVEWAVLTRCTDECGNVNESGKFSPYMTKGAANPFTGKTKVAPAGKGDADAGWTYDEKTGAFRVLLSAGDAKKSGLAERDVEVLK